MTIDDLLQIIMYPGCNEALLRQRCVKWLPAILRAMSSHQINTPQRQAHFVAQTAHESGRFQYCREIWGPTAAQRGYDGRADLGNTHPGDGFNFRGRGLIQITGRANYQQCGDAIGLDLVGHPELLEMPENAADASAWWWNQHGLNVLADIGDVERVTRRINGGTNGLQDRKALTDQAMAVLCGKQSPAAV